MFDKKELSEEVKRSLNVYILSLESDRLCATIQTAAINRDLIEVRTTNKQNTTQMILILAVKTL